VVNDLMTNRLQGIDFGTLDKFCRYFGVKPSELLDYEEGEEGGG